MLLTVYVTIQYMLLYSIHYCTVRNHSVYVIILYITVQYMLLTVYVTIQYMLLTVYVTIQYMLLHTICSYTQTQQITLWFPCIRQCHITIWVFYEDQCLCTVCYQPNWQHPIITLHTSPSTAPNWFFLHCYKVTKTLYWVLLSWRHPINMSHSVFYLTLSWMKLISQVTCTFFINKCWWKLH
jgi:hypothetical protein